MLSSRLEPYLKKIMPKEKGRPFSEMNIDLATKKYLSGVIKQGAMGYMRMFKDILELGSMTSAEIIWIESKFACEEHADWLKEAVDIARKTNNSLQ
jgi:hypothetical protein